VKEGRTQRSPAGNSDAMVTVMVAAVAVSSVVHRGGSDLAVAGGGVGGAQAPGCRIPPTAGAGSGNTVRDRRFADSLDTIDDSVCSQA
jgi:hypothetical protein